MKKIYTYIALAPIVSLALMPPIGMYVPFNNKVAWTWLVLLSAFAGFYTFFLKINPIIKVLTALCFINVLFSRAPMISQFAYMEMIGCVYLYWICRRIEDWSIVFNALWVILAINILMLSLQMAGKDTLLNFGFYQSSCHGVVGNIMQFRSYMIVLIALLIQQYKPKKETLIKAGICAGIIAISYFFAHRVFVSFMFARGPVWIETVRLGMEHPFIGWGIGTYKAIFASIAQYCHPATVTEGRWMSAHSEWLQMMFEVGIPGYLLLCGLAINLLMKCRGVLLFGALLVGFTMSVHFPMRTTQIVPLLILFVAYIERENYGLTKQN